MCYAVATQQHGAGLVWSSDGCAGLFFLFLLPSRVCLFVSLVHHCVMVCLLVFCTTKVESYFYQHRMFEIAEAADVPVGTKIVVHLRESTNSLRSPAK